ncbi:hypothetical protein, variant [Verruconis gallopava]|uniref:Uncharacterized protein n=1 Tax=Verruconis gallopava TaxID=253628 RepID=A0A0D1YIQ5_9PEZI|nr:uncharacterized protein PV09_07734 [Verruconis gallopava]XP_016210621.1 hypothetical protein, variant [Verruconis gallopava]KIW00751.1 hypothetical protein PV09_07734 [Verruconis gallopava]KIW00752.1 hypothetical protein, variant [Verruconis gallopava]
MAERPSLGRDDSYNRVTVSSNLKSQIMSMIADSSESLPLGVVSESDEDEESTAATTNTKETTKSASNLSTQEPLNASDMVTPTPEKPNPLEQIPTETMGTTASRTTTASLTQSNDNNSRPGLDKRQSTMKRISGVFKKSTSKNQ